VAAGSGSGSVAAGLVVVARVARVAVHRGERAACAKSHGLTAGLTKDSPKLRSASRWLRVQGRLRVTGCLPACVSATSGLPQQAADLLHRPTALGHSRFWLDGARV
jgi:hypothetical protein